MAKLFDFTDPMGTENPTGVAAGEFQKSWNDIWDNPDLSEDEKATLSNKLREEAGVVATEAKVAGRQETVLTAKKDLADYADSLPTDLTPEKKKFLLAAKMKNILDTHGVNPYELAPAKKEVEQPVTAVSTEAPSAAPSGVPGVSEGPTLRGLAGRVRAQSRRALTDFEKTQEKIADAQEEKTLALESARIRGEALAAEESTYFTKQEERQQKQAVTMQGMEEERTKRIQPLQDEFTGLLDDIKTAKIDPGRFWESRDTSQKVAFVLAAMLGTLAAGLRREKGHDPLAFLNKLSDRDIAAQKSNIENMRTAASGQSSLLAQMRAVFDDERGAEAAVRATQLQAANAELNKLRGRAGSVQMQNQIDQAQANIEVEIQKSAQAALSTQNSIIMTGLQTEANLIAQQRAIAAQEAAAQGKGMADMIKNQKEMQQLSVPGMAFSGEKRPTRDDAKTVQEAREGLVHLMGTVKAIEQLQKTFGTEYLSMIPGFETGPTKEMQSLAATLKFQLDVAYKLGSLSGQDYENLYKIVPEDPSGFWQDDITTLLNRVKTQANEGFLTTARQRGYVEQELGSDERLGIR